MWLRSRRGLAPTVAPRVEADAPDRDTSDRVPRLEAAVGLAPIGVVVLDAEGTVQFANEEAQQYVKTKRDGPVARAPMRAALERLMDPEAPADAATEIELTTPTHRFLGVRSRRLEAGAGYIVFVDDITERRRIDAIRRDFVANASHELKTPLGALSVLAETLADTDDPETRLRLTDRIGEQAHRMSHLIDDILDLALVESTSDRSPVAVHTVMTEAVKDVDILSHEYAVPVDVEPIDVDLRLMGDHRQLVSALSNLLENAIKYTHKSGYPILAPVEVEAWEDGDSVVIEIEDHGIGIPESHLPRIFERFYRVDPARTRDSGGTGLGLAIVRHVVLNHDGKIDVSSVPGVGSTFRVTLPVWRD